MYLIKSRRLDEEIENAENALNMLYTKYEKKYKYELEYDHSERYLVFLDVKILQIPSILENLKRLKQIHYKCFM